MTSAAASPEQQARTADTPILLLAFNRPEATRRVFERIAGARPERLYVAVDGPRPGHPTDAERRRRVLQCLDAIDWPCELHRLVREENLGCGRAVSSAISWFLEREEYGVILEDDCLVSPSFLPFAADLLRRHADDENVLAICAANPLPPSAPVDTSYFASRHPLMWGWATWRRAWAGYDFTMAAWPEARRQRWLRGIRDDWVFETCWRSLFDDTHSGRTDTWDYQWIFSCWQRGGVCLLPQQNLVENLGIGQDATHTVDDADPRAHLVAGALELPLSPPATLCGDPELDAAIDAHWFEVSVGKAIRDRLRGLPGAQETFDALRAARRRLS